MPAEAKAALLWRRSPFPPPQTCLGARKRDGRESQPRGGARRQRLDEHRRNEGFCESTVVAPQADMRLDEHRRNGGFCESTVVAPQADMRLDEHRRSGGFCESTVVAPQADGKPQKRRGRGL